MKKSLLAAAVAVLTLPATADDKAPPSPLPVKQVTLFTSGVAYVERGGEVTGDAAVPLAFRTPQINDILKSLIQLDERGRVQPATYTARDPITRTLQAFSLDVTQNSPLAELLSQARGAKVTLTVGEKSLSGQLVSIESRVVAVQEGKPFVTWVLNLLTEAGLTWVRLDTVNLIQFADENRSREFRQALDLLASNADDQRRTVTLHFAGEGRRQVRVGYVTESPLWKTSYRLMVGGAGAKQPAGKSYLQGWALVENTSDEDWQGIRLSLVSGRPVSFIQDLYQPLYLPRPVVPVDIVASPYPQTHGANLEENKQRMARMPGGGPGPGGAAGAGGFGANGQGGRGGSGGGAMGPAGANGPAGVTAYDVDNTLVTRYDSDDSLRELKEVVRTFATGQKSGEQFAYRIKTPVTLPRQQAAMIPIVSQDIDTEKVAIFNADSGKFPLNAIRIRNTTGLHLKGGPITLFDEGVYAGDARMEDVPPGDSRLVSYAVDTTLEGERQGVRGSDLETTIVLRQGVLTTTTRERQETTYVVRSKSDRAKTVVVEHPYRPDLKLVSPEKPAERTAQVYRIAVNVPPGGSQKLVVVTEGPTRAEFAILQAGVTTIAGISNRRDISAKLRAALEEIVSRRRATEDFKSQAASREAEIKAMGDDQDRIRKNMAALDKTSALYKRYVAELDRQETRLQTLRHESGALRKHAADAEHDLKTFVDGLNIAG